MQESAKTNIETIGNRYIKRLKPREKELRLDLYHIKQIVDVESAVNYAIEGANYLVLEEEWHDLQSIIGQLKYVDIMIKMSSKDEQLSIVRQGFILLMTAFDATIFDLLRIALNKTSLV